jgi:hypothetical protein
MKTEAPTETPAASTGNARFSDPITLVEPIVRGEHQITSLILRKPKAGELRGLSLKDLLTSEVDAYITLLPRISDPILSNAEAAQLDPADLAELGGVIRGFFLTAAERAQIAQMTEHQQGSMT